MLLLVPMLPWALILLGTVLLLGPVLLLLLVRVTDTTWVVIHSSSISSLSRAGCAQG